MKGTDSALTSPGFVGYCKQQACYKDKACAIRAVIIRTLVKVATGRELIGCDPTWASRLLPRKEDLREHVVLYENGFGGDKNDRLFGILQFWYGKRVLSIPRDYSDLTEPWEDFVSDEYPHNGDNGK